MRFYILVSALMIAKMINPEAFKEFNGLFLFILAIIGAFLDLCDFFRGQQ